MPGPSSLRRIAGEIRRDVRAAQERDPAAAGVSALGIVTAWPAPRDADVVPLRPARGPNPAGG
jgi:hypothetical protein